MLVAFGHLCEVSRETSAVLVPDGHQLSFAETVVCEAERTLNRAKLLRSFIFVAKCPP